MSRTVDQRRLVKLAIGLVGLFAIVASTTTAIAASSFGNNKQTTTTSTTLAPTTAAPTTTTTVATTTTEAPTTSTTIADLLVSAAGRATTTTKASTTTTVAGVTTTTIAGPTTTKAPTTTTTVKTTKTTLPPCDAPNALVKWTPMWDTNGKRFIVQKVDVYNLPSGCTSYTGSINIYGDPKPGSTAYTSLFAWTGKITLVNDSKGIYLTVNVSSTATVPTKDVTLVNFAIN